MEILAPSYSLLALVIVSFKLEQFTLSQSFVVNIFVDG